MGRPAAPVVAPLPRRRDGSPPSPPPIGSRVACAPAAPSPVGVTTMRASPPHPPDRTATCRGENSLGQANPPDGEFAAVAAGSELSCGVGTDGGIRCWGADHAQRLRGRVYRNRRQRRPPVRCAHRRHHQLCRRMGGPRTVRCSRGTVHVCRRRTESLVWIARRRHDRLLGRQRFRPGQRPGRRIRWGSHPDWDFGQADAPSGEFTAIAAAGLFSCGLRADGTIACWGREPVVGPPSGVQFTNN